MSTFNPPPGWPPMPAGWTPPARWVQPAEWPQAPEGWQWWSAPVWQRSTAQPGGWAPAQPYRMVTKQKQDTSHTFHLLMSLLTCGAWAVFVWLPIIVWHEFGPRAKSITKMGR